MKDVSGDREDSYRWLMGEEVPAFGGAIRDMWNPTCYGDPGKVSDVEYYCAPDDGGGVHSNSGVPNHAYALLVDGGTPTTAPTITGLGLDKAAASTSARMTALPDADHRLRGPRGRARGVLRRPGRAARSRSSAPTPNALGRPRPTTIATADCATCRRGRRATELRKEPVQCNFQPMFNQDASGACGDGQQPRHVHVMERGPSRTASRPTGTAGLRGRSSAARASPGSPARRAHRQR